MTSYNAIFIAFGNFFRQACFFLAQILIANSIGIGSFGLYSAFFSIMLILEAFGSLGTRMSLWKHIAKKITINESKIIFYVLARFILAFVFVVIAYFILSIFNFRESEYLLFFLIIILFNQSTFDWIFLARGETQKVVSYNMAAGLIYLVFLYFYFLFYKNILFLPLIFSLSFLIPGIFLMRKEIFNFRFFNFKTLLRFQRILIFHSKEYFGYDLIQRLYLSLPIILTFYATSSSLAGEFRLISLVIMLAVTLSTSLAFGYFNKIAVHDSKDKNYPISGAIVLIFILVIPLSFYFENIVSIDFFQGVIPDIIEIENIIYAVNLLGFIAFANILRELYVPMGKVIISSISYIIFFVCFSVLVIYKDASSIISLINFLVISEAISLLFMIFMINTYSLFLRFIENLYYDRYIIILLSLICLISFFLDLGIYSIFMLIVHAIAVQKYITKVRHD